MKTTIDRAGRVVIPKAVRDQLNLVPGMSLEVTAQDGTAVIEPTPVPMRLVKENGHLVIHADAPVPPLTQEKVREILEATRDKLI